MINVKSIDKIGKIESHFILYTVFFSYFLTAETTPVTRWMKARCLNRFQNCILMIEIFLLLLYLYLSNIS